MNNLNEFDVVADNELNSVVGGSPIGSVIGYVLGYAIPDYSKMMEQQRAYTRSSPINN